MERERKQTNEKKSPEDVVEKVRAAAHELIQHNRGRDDGGLTERLKALLAVAKRLSERSFKPPSSSRARQKLESRRSKYTNFLLALQGYSPPTRALCVIVIRKVWINLMRLDEIQELHRLLKQDQNAKIFNDPALSWLAKLADEPDMLGRVIPPPAPVGASNQEAIQAPEKVSMPPLSVTLGPIEPDVPYTTSVEVKWSEGVSGIFGEQFASVTSYAVGRKVTMIFSKSPSSDCVLSFPLELPTAKSLVSELFGIAIHFHGEKPPSGRNPIATYDGSTPIDFRCATVATIIRIFGEGFWQYTGRCVGRQFESPELTNCVSVSISKLDSTLSVCLTTRDGLEVLGELDKNEG